MKNKDLIRGLWGIAVMFFFTATYFGLDLFWFLATGLTLGIVRAAIELLPKGWLNNNFFRD